MDGMSALGVLFCHHKIGFFWAVMGMAISKAWLVGRAGGVGVVAGSMGLVDVGNVCFKAMADFTCGCRYQGAVW